MVDFALSDRVAASGRRGVGGTLIQHFLVQIYLTPRGLISFFSGLLSCVVLSMLNIL